MKIWLLPGWPCGTKAGCPCSSSHRGYWQMPWLLLSTQTCPGRKRWHRPQERDPPLPKRPSSEDVTPSSGVVTPQPPGSVTPGWAGGHAARWLVCLMRAYLARRAGSACLHRPPPRRQLPGTALPGRSVLRFVLWFTAGAELAFPALMSLLQVPSLKISPV